MINKEMIENAAKNYAKDVHLNYISVDDCDSFEQIKEEISDGFESGVMWAIEQMSNDAIEFAVWLHNNQFIRYIQSADGDVPYGPNKNFKGCIWVSTKIQYLSEFYNAHELYQLYLNSKTK